MQEYSSSCTRAQEIEDLMEEEEGGEGESSEVEDLHGEMTILIVTSPAPRNPDTSMVWAVINSCDSYLGGLDKCNVVVVADGYNLSTKIRRGNEYSLSKAGMVTKEVQSSYEQFKTTLQLEMKAKNEASQNSRIYTLLSLQEHHGFALAVKKGLEFIKCTPPHTKHCLILQHDRAFTRQFSQKRVCEYVNMSYV